MSSLFDWLSSLFRGVRFWVVIQPWERAVHVRLGKRERVLGPGVHLRIPLADEVTVVNTRLRIAPVPCQTISTLDGKAVTVGAVVGFRVVDPLKAMRALQAPERACAAYVQALIARHLSSRQWAEIAVPGLEADALAGLDGFGGGGLAYDFVRVVDFAAVRTFRLLQEQWRPSTAEQGL